MCVCVCVRVCYIHVLSIETRKTPKKSVSGQRTTVNNTCCIQNTTSTTDNPTTDNKDVSYLAGGSTSASLLSYTAICSLRTVRSSFSFKKKKKHQSQHALHVHER